MDHDDIGDRVSADKELRSRSNPKGVYSEIDPALYGRLVDRRKKNRKLRKKLDSNYKIIEAGIKMILDFLDKLDYEKESK